MDAKDTDRFVLSKGGMARLTCAEYAKDFGTDYEEGAQAAKRIEGLLETSMKGHEAVDWYANREDLRCGQVFRTHDGSIVKLDRSVPGDGTKWYVADWWSGSWAYMDSTIEPGNLAERLSEQDYV